ncbi:glycerophosphodiester phosphodiesterase [Oceanobacillus salinisoli]|uniref:glycerophosphodiester phosphodiesterase n=1 Tax=Oceanobacillus salinisoli TaxID=2678611 RepID=UPI0012E11080|nr:glycerophosphodiester phosphodiesterase family protein [Oceanobacillus salinisoli]
MTDLKPILTGGNKPYIEGHRGAPTLCPENTISAFNKAVEVKADLIEIDVQLSKDNEIVVFHDEKLDKKSDGTGFLRDYTLSELQRLDVGSWFSPAFTGERMPTLEEVLDWGKGKIWLSIELKNIENSKHLLVKKAVELVQSYAMEEQVQIISFNHDMLAQVRKYSKTIMTSAITPCRLVDPVKYLKSFDAQVLNGPGEYLTKELVDEIHHAGLYVNGGMVNDIELWKKLEGYGVDLMCTNLPETMKGE